MVSAGESLRMKIIGKPYSGKPNVRFDEGELEIERTATTPALYSTIYFLDGIVGMTAASDAKGKVGAVMARRRSDFCGEHETMIDIHSGMLLETEVGLVILDHPVRFKIAEKT